MRKFRSLADRVNVTAVKTGTFVLEIVFESMTDSSLREQMI